MRPAPFKRVLAMALALTVVLALTGCAWLRDRVAPAPPLDAAQQRSLDALYARGAQALQANDVDGAIAAWRAFAQAAPRQQPRARQVRGYLTLLDREAARRFAQRAAAQEQARQSAPAGRLHVALLPVAQPGADAAAAAPFNRALMAMITTDLSRVPAITLLEREKVDHLLRERQLAASGLVDPATLGVQGRLLGVGSVITGSVTNEPGPAGPGSGRYRINSAVADVGAGRLLGTQQVEGLQSEFFTLQKRIVYAILESLGVRDLPPGVHRIHTRSWQAYAAFARGLQLLDENRFDEARTAFRSALGHDPAFELAEDALLDTPERPATLAEIQAAVRTGR